MECEMCGEDVCDECHKSLYVEHGTECERCKGVYCDECINDHACIPNE